VGRASDGRVVRRCNHQETRLRPIASRHCKAIFDWIDVVRVKGAYCKVGIRGPKLENWAVSSHA
jgi:hypothetical protein